MGVQQVTQWGCYLNCSGSGTGVQAPIGVATPRLIVEGVAVPEPSTDLLLFLMATALCFWIARNRYRFSGGPSCDKGTCSLHR